MIKSFATASIVGAVVLGSAGAAFASNTGWLTCATQDNASATARFESGQRLWYSRNDNHGAFRLKGYLNDRSNNDRSVKFQVKVEAYSPTVYNAPEDADKTIPDMLYWDPAMTITPDASIQTCQRNILSDDCSNWRQYNNPYYS